MVSGIFWSLFVGTLVIFSWIEQNFENLYAEIYYKESPQCIPSESSHIISDEHFFLSKIIHFFPRKNIEPPKQDENICIKNPTITTFMYHYIRDSSPNDARETFLQSVPIWRFKDQMEVVEKLAQEKRIALMKGDELNDAFQTRCFPHPNIWIFTSDDGWIDSFDTLAPIANEHKIPFIFGIIVGKVNHHGFVTTENIKKLSENPLFTIASHTISHHPLNYGSLANAKREICESKTMLEKIIQKPVDFFIYPQWKIGNHSVLFLKECGYKLAWGTPETGIILNWNHLQQYKIKRKAVPHNASGDFFKNLVK